jgi:uncharacterized protein YtpQ (UPF0354 family)
MITQKSHENHVNQTFSHKNHNFFYRKEKYIRINHIQKNKEFIVILKEKWLTIENSYLEKSVNSMLCRVGAVIESKENPTRYSINTKQFKKK